MKRGVIALSIVATTVIGVGITYRYWTRTPRYALTQITGAIRDHDVTTFRKYVDVQSISSRLIDDLMRAFKESKADNAAEAFGQALGAGLVQYMKPRLVEIMEEQVSRLVEQGEFSERREAEGEPAPAKSISLKRLSEDLGTDENSFTGIEYTKTSGKVAVIGVGSRNKRYGEKLVLELKFRDMGTHWQLAEFSNLTELLERIRQLDAQKLEEINRPIRDQIVRSLRVVSATKHSRTDRWEISKEVNIELSVENSSTKAVQGFSAVVRAFDSIGKLVKEIRIKNDDPIAPLTTNRGVWTIHANMFDSSDNRLYELPKDEVRLDTQFDRVTFADGSELKIFSSLDEASKR